MGAVDNLRLVGVADVLTMANGLSGLLAIYFFATQGTDITLGSAMILLGFVFDGADGWAARRFGTKHDFGRNLDSISDAITFCAAPAAMVYVTFTGAMDDLPGSSARLSAGFDGFVLGTSISILVLGIARLWRFATRGYLLPYFRGLATPAMAFLSIMVCHILSPQFEVNQVLGVPAAAVSILFFASLLMVSQVEYPKVRGRTAITFALFVVAGLMLIGALRYLEVDWTFALYRVVSVLALTLVVGYVLLGPVYMGMVMRRDETS
jgi:archaetidylserine synthase